MSEHRLFQFFRGKKANMPTLSEAEPAYATDEKRLYVGDGSTNVGMAKQSDIPTKTSQLTNDSGFKTTDNNTTYALSKSGSTITLTGSDGKTTSVTDADTAYTHPSSHPASMITGLAKVATSGSYNDLSNKPTSMTPAAHNQASSTINAMTGYSKPSSTGAIATTDTLNGAIGKLEKALDGKQASGSYSTTGHKHTKSEITDFPTLATVATSGSYNDLSNKPTIPSAYSLPAAGSSLGGVKSGGDVTISSGVITVNDDSHNHVIDNIDGLRAQINAYNTEIENLRTNDSYASEDIAEIKTELSELGFVRRVSCSSSDGVAYTGSTTGVTALTSGLTIIFIPSKTSASKTPTLNLNNLGAKSIKRRLSHLSTTTQEGYSTTWLYANKPYFLTYDGTQWIVEGLTKPSAADLYGTPAAATKATQDGNGNVITDTYATKASIPTAAAIANEVVEFLKDRGDTIVGAVNSNKDITLVSGLADGVYALKYENSDGTKTEIGYLNMAGGIGTVTSYKNVLDPSTTELNVRWSNSSYAFVTSSGTGHFATDFIPVTLSTDASNPTILHFRGATYTNQSHIVFYNANKTIINSATASTNGAGMQVSTTAVTTDENGDYQVSLGYKNGAFDSAWRSGVAYMRVSLYVGNKTLTAADMKNVIISVNDLIED